MRGSPLRFSWVFILLVLLAAACYETAVAVGWIGLGSDPGNGAPGERGMLLAGLAASLAAAIMCWVAGSVSWARYELLALFLAPVGAAFMAARFYTFDPYYLPTLRRMSDGGVIFPAWVFVLVVLALLAAILVRLRPNVGLRLSAVVLVACATTALFEGTGH